MNGKNRDGKKIQGIERRKEMDRRKKIIIDPEVIETDGMYSCTAEPHSLQLGMLSMPLSSPWEPEQTLPQCTVHTNDWAYSVP